MNYAGGAGGGAAAAVGHNVLELTSRLHQHLVEVDNYRSGMLRVKGEP